MGYEESNTFKSTAPGSAMLFGEHAVLKSKMAIVAAVDKRVTIDATLRQDNKINITSPQFGEYHTDINHLSIQPPYQFVLGVLASYQSQLEQGLDITIQSEMSHQVGLGTSAAVTVAMVDILSQITEQELSKQEILITARQVCKQVQGGVGSGADVAASVYGGITAYRPAPLYLETYTPKLPLVLIYSGSKTPTAEVIKQVNEEQEKHEELYKHLFEAIAYITKQAITAIRHDDKRALGHWMWMHQGLQETLGVNTAVLAKILAKLRQIPTVFGAKISGSGLGDCVVALGEVPESAFSHEPDPQTGIYQIPIAIAHKGVERL